MGVMVTMSAILQGVPRTPVLTPVDRMSGPGVAAHRCGMSRYPENTLTAARGTLRDHPGTVLEFDVRPLRDGTLVVNHDASVDRTAAGGRTGAVSGMSVADWRSLGIKHPQGGDSAPASFLQDFLDEYGGTDQIMLIELKDASSQSAFIEQLWPYRDQVIVASFNASVVSVLVRSGFYTQQLISGTTLPDLVPGIYMAGIEDARVNPTSLAHFHSQDVPLWAWGNSLQPLDERLLGMGLDGFIVNDMGSGPDA